MLKPNARSLSLTSQESYSAIIIADLVAEVPIQTETEQENKKTSKEENNFAYDGQMDGETNPAVLGVNTVETANLRSSNRMGISRGVILNAVQFGQSDPKTKSEEKPIQLKGVLPVQTIAQSTSEPKGLKDMTFMRKIAFGFSFLPSVLFVLCFAVILPCRVPKPCIEDRWTTTLNNTEVTSNLEILQSVMFTVYKEGKHLLMTLDENDGSELHALKIDFRPTYLKCTNVVSKDSEHCVIMDKFGNMYLANGTHGTFIWNPGSDDRRQLSLPVFLPDCNNDGIEEIAVAVSKSEIKILYGGNIISSFFINDCDSLPIKLTSWARKDSSNIVFICEKGGEDRIIKVPQDVWCIYKKAQGETLILHSQKDSLKESHLRPTEDGLVLWAGDIVSFLQPSGSELWQNSNISHSNKNRFLLYGNFIGSEQQVAVISSNIASKFQVTLLDPSNGRIIKTRSFENLEATEVKYIKGKEKDFALLLLKKRKKDLVTETLSQINDISSTIVNFISDEMVTDNGTDIAFNPLEELMFYDLDGRFQPIKEIEFGYPKSAAYKSTITAVHDGVLDVLHIYFLRTVDHSSYNITEIKNINVDNWDISSHKTFMCKMA